MFQPLVASAFALGGRSVRHVLQEIVKLGECGEGVFAGIQDADVEVRGARGGFAELRGGFVDVEVGAEGWGGC